VHSLTDGYSIIRRLNADQLKSLD
jgi:hypothetical protein